MASQSIIDARITVRLLDHGIGEAAPMLMDAELLELPHN